VILPAPYSVGGLFEACRGAGIGDPAAFIKSKRMDVFDWLKGAFPRGGLPSDLDGVVELNGWFLVFENKDESVLKDGSVKVGQALLLSRLVDMGRFFVVVIGYDKENRASCYQTIDLDWGWGPVVNATPAEVYELCRAWATWAERQPRMRRVIEP